jgi:tetratricopeptide (TPR) repeat protein
MNQEALNEYQQSLAIIKRLAGQDESNPSLRRDLSVSYNRVGEALKAQGKYEDALDDYGKVWRS